MRRQRERYLTQIFHVKPQIHAGTFSAMMAKNIADVLKRNTPTQQMHGV
jgi:hypothetical protein